MKPYVSIIIPVYKVEKYLRECLDSILCWTFSDWEAILIDDGSPDNSGIICDEYAAKDIRFKVIHKLNEGVSVARNTGLDVAKGEWCWFVDSDDLIDIDTPVNLSLYRDKDIIIFNIKLFSEGTSIPHENEVITYDACRDVNAFFTKYISYTHPTHWYNRKFWDKEGYYAIRFSKGVKLGEDLEFMRKCELLAMNPFKVNHTNYYYRLRENSAYHKYGIEQQVINDTFKVMENLYDFIINNDITFFKAHLYRLAKLANCIPINAIRADLWSKELQEKYKILINKYKGIGADLSIFKYIWIATKMPWLLKYIVKIKS